LYINILGVEMRRILSLVLMLALAACSVQDENVDWPMHGRDNDAQRYSPLDAINRDTVGRLGLSWSHDLETDRGQEATPIVVDGVIYIASAYQIVQALDARSGAVLWTYDPQVRAASARSCCGPVSRGVAVAGGKVFLGALDGRLIALDARTGAPVWETQTVDQGAALAENYTITGAARIVKDMVIIGNGGAEFGARGYVSAYDQSTGALRWRFYTVPGQPGTTDNAASDPAMARALPTWHGDWWRWGGGGTVWDAIEYDPGTDLVYIGTGNGSPWNHGQRSDGEGDNLYLSSIVALRADSGEYAWHFQETPAETWDYTATQNIVLADLEINGQARKVLLHAPKNGFFYVLDRETGQFISGQPFVDVNWATGLDPVSGRPIEVPAARYYRTGQPFMQNPSSGGAHNWPPMAFSRDTGLVYIPAQDVAIPYEEDLSQPQISGAYNSGVALPGGGQMQGDTLRAVHDSMKGYLIAWDPVTQRERWRVHQAAPFNGGVLATGGGLVFGGTAARELVAYDDSTGEVLWRFDAQTGVVAPPITYVIDSVQYVAVMAGAGGGWPLLGGPMALKAGNPIGPNRLLVFALDGTATLPPYQAPVRPQTPIVTAMPTDAAGAMRGDTLYGRFCLRCHGTSAVSASALPDLRLSPMVMNDAFYRVVLEGALAPRGMPGFQGKLTQQQANDIRAYLARRSFEDFGGN
jgi:quinohemoprotein ethanol dehydrogenase